MTLRPRRSKRQIVCSDFFKKSERIYFAAPPSQITTAALGCDLGSPLCGVFRFCRNIGFNRYLHKNNHTFRCGYFYEPGLQSGYFSVVTIFPLSGGRSPPYESFTGNTILERKYLAHCKYAKVPIYKISRISFGI